MVTTTKSTEETENIANRFVENVLQKGNSSDGALVVCLNGELGAGKTSFVKGAAKSFGLTQTVTSPTFVIEKIYKLDNSFFNHLIHIDAYRLKSGDELLHLGWSEISKDPKNIIFIEWPENIKEILPKDLLEINFTFISEEEREIDFQNIDF